MPTRDPAPRSAAPDLPDRVRQALADHYAIGRELGRGGMGVVYLARDLRHDRPVALKLLLPGILSRSGPERFQREIRLAARLQHPHILTVLDSGSIDGDAGMEQLWYTMPFVDGESLHARLDREHHLSLEEALRITAEVARALAYAHQQGVVHRDVKPENILLTSDGTTLVGDFGVARGIGVDDSLTRTGTPVGTPFYMSPEQTDDGEVDGRTDEYALAAVLYEMLSGEPPFVGRTLQAIIARRLSNPTPSVRLLRDSVPLYVDEAIRRAMAPVPEDRFPGVQEFVQALLVPSLASTPEPVPAAARAPSRRSRISRVAIGLIAGVLVIGGGLLTWYRAHLAYGRPHTGPSVIAVLPFENLGDSADAYFADGVSDEIRAKLAQLGGLELIARGSSLEYRHTTRRPDAVAHELGADYLLTGTVRWDKVAGGSRVRVTPELVDVRGQAAARTRWTQQFDASLTDVFQVQADIASKVADALGVALADSARRGLAARPTASLAAWDAFLQGEAAAEGMKADQAGLRRAIVFYERAVSLDSSFAQAWSQLSRARTSLYSNGIPNQALADAARTAAERARALRPDDPLAYLAAGDYYSSVNPIDNDRAAEEYEHGLRLAPDDVELLSAAATAGGRLRHWDSTLPRLERAFQLDPRSTTVARRLAVVHIFMRHNAAADSAVDRALALAPTNPQILLLKVMATLARGDLDSARAVVRSAARLLDPATLYAFLATYQDLYWVLDDPQQRVVLELPPGAFDDDRGVWAIVRAELYQLRGATRLATAYADSARLELLAQSRAQPEDAQRHAILGVALAYLGRKGEAIREGRRGVELLPIERDAFAGPYVQLQLVRIYLLTGEADQALDQLEPLLRVPFYLSPGWLRVDPTFDPVRSYPRFQHLLAAEPASGAS